MNEFIGHAEWIHGLNDNLSVQCVANGINHSVYPRPIDRKQHCFAEFRRLSDGARICPIAQLGQKRGNFASLAVLGQH